MSTFKMGETVIWESHGGEVTGTVVKKFTEPVTINGHRAKPTRDNPQYLVRSKKTKKRAIHKPNSLRKVR